LLLNRAADFAYCYKVIESAVCLSVAHPA